MIERDPVGRLVHELRTPLAVVSGFAELLERRGDALTPQQRAEYLARIIEGVREMDQILDRSRE
jgi:signal transduction histidine kinase